MFPKIWSNPLSPNFLKKWWTIFTCQINIVENKSLYKAVKCLVVNARQSSLQHGVEPLKVGLNE
jgi:hypothetical protein